MERINWFLTLTVKQTKVFPLWSMSEPSEGGLGFSTDQIGMQCLLSDLSSLTPATDLLFFCPGITSSIGSLGVVVIQLFMYTPIAKKLGTSLLTLHVQQIGS